MLITPRRHVAEARRAICICLVTDERERPRFAAALMIQSLSADMPTLQ